MKYIRYLALGVPEDKKYLRAKKDLDEFLQIFKMAYGGLKIQWYKSDLPKTIFGSVKNSVKVSREKSNHAIAKWEGRKLVEFFYDKQKYFGFRLRGFFYDKNVEGISSDESIKIVKMMERYNFKAYEIPFLEYGIKALIVALIIVILIIVQIVRQFL